MGDLRTAIAVVILTRRKKPGHEFAPQAALNDIAGRRAESARLYSPALWAGKTNAEAEFTSPDRSPKSAQQKSPNQVGLVFNYEKMEDTGLEPVTFRLPASTGHRQKP